MSSTIFISAGEASGEHYGALLIDALKVQLAASGQAANFIGMGGPRMEAAGLLTIVRSEDMAVMGLTEVVLHLPRIWREYRKLKRAIRRHPPGVAILIDFPEIHFRLAKEFHRLGVPVIFFVSPQLWAWKKHRIKLVHQYIDKMLVIFPFEEPFYRERGVPAEFVGHPLAELPLPAVTREDFAAANHLDPGKIWIGLLPGSRPREIRDHLPTLLQAACGIQVLKGHGFGRAANGLRTDVALAAEGMCGVEEVIPQGLKPGFSIHGSSARLKSCPFKASDSSNTGNADPSTAPDAKSASDSAQDDRVSFEFLIPLAPTLNAAQREEVRNLVKNHSHGLTVRLIDDMGAEGSAGPTAGGAVLLYARASIVASGTATVEAALIGNPFVVVYRVSALTYAIAKRVVTVPHVAMANLIAGKQVVPELIQSDFTAENIVQQIAPLLPDGPPRQSMMQELAQIRGLLQTRQPVGGAIGRVAAITLELLHEKSPG
jgi:lipid-A-disaccharide synthase